MEWSKSHHPKWISKLRTTWNRLPVLVGLGSRRRRHAKWVPHCQWGNHVQVTTCHIYIARRTNLWTLWLRMLGILRFEIPLHFVNSYFLPNMKKVLRHESKRHLRIAKAACMVQLSFVKVTKPHLECCGLGDVFIFRLPSQSLLPEISKNVPFRSHARCGGPIWFVFAPSNVFKVIFQQVCSFLKESQSALQNLIPVDHKLWAAVCRQKTGRWQSKNLHDGVKTWSPVQQMSVVVQMQNFSWKVIHKRPGCHQLEHHVQISQVQMPRRIILEENGPIGEVSKIPVNMKQVATALITWLHCSITSLIDKHCWDAVQLFAKGVDRRILWALQIDQNTMLRRQT